MNAIAEYQRFRVHAEQSVFEKATPLSNTLYSICTMPNPSFTPPSTRSHLTTLELRTARTSDRGAEAMAQILATLPNPSHNPLLFWTHAPHITLEFFSHGQTIYCFLTTPTSLIPYLTSQLSVGYPEILIKTLEHHPLQEFTTDLPKAAGRMVLASSSHHSLTTYKETPADQLANMLSVLSQLGDQESALIQIHARKSREYWKMGSVAETLLTSNQSTPAQPTAPIQKKLDQQGFQIEIRLLAQAPTQTQAKIILHNVSAAFGSYRSADNYLVLKTPLIYTQTLINTILTRKPQFSFWQPQHVSLDELATLYHLPNKLLATIKNIAWGKTLLGEPPENLPIYTANASDQQKLNLNLFAKTIYKNTEQIFGVQRDDRMRHMYVLGKSGTGKSTLLANMIINDLKHGEGLAVIDPHGDLIETVLNYIPKHRINDVIVFDPADPHAVVKLNLFDGGTAPHRELIASGIVAIFHKLYANSWGPRLEYILRNTLLTLLTKRAKLEDVLRLLTDKKFRAHIVETLEDPILKNFWVAEFEKMPERLRQEAISPILNKVGQFVTSPLVRNVVNNTESSFSIEDVMNEGKILLVNVSQGKLGEHNAALLGAMVITQIQLAAMNRVYQDEKNRRDFFLYIDEFQNFATTSFISILSEARKYRLSLTMANQYIAQIPEDVRSAIFGNAGSMVSFLMGAADAACMVPEFEKLYTSEDLVSLGRYQVITRLLIDNMVSRPFPAYTLPLASSANLNKEKVLKVSRERYARVNA